MRSRNRGSSPLAGAWMLLLASVLVSGCGRDAIRVYHIAKEDAWKLPAGWQEREAGGMRAARFAIPSTSGTEIDVSIIPIPRGFSGSHVEIINIWRQQMQLEPVQSDTDAGRLSEMVLVGKLEGELYEMTSPDKALQGKAKAKTLVAAAKKDGASWFIKMTGDEAGVDQNKPAFLSFLKTVNLNNVIPPASPAMAGSGDPHAGGAAGHEGHEGHDHSSHPEWAVPAGWTEQAPTQMVNAKFSIAGEGGARADVNVSVLSGEGGGLRENINRWRKQVGLDPWDDAALEKNVVTIDAGGRKAMVVDIQGGKDARSGAPARLIGVIVPHEGQTWFYKLLGDEQVAAREKEAFLRFVSSAKYPNPNG